MAEKCKIATRCAIANNCTSRVDDCKVVSYTNIWSNPSLFDDYAKFLANMISMHGMLLVNQANSELRLWQLIQGVNNPNFLFIILENFAHIILI